MNDKNLLSLKYFYGNDEKNIKTGTIDAKSKELEKITRRNFENGEAYILLYKLDAVQMGYYKEGNISFYKDPGYTFVEDYLSMRIFNEKKELYIWKVDNKFMYRYRKDNNYTIEKCMKNMDKPTIVYDEYHMMLGNVRSSRNGWSLFCDSRGSEILFPKSYNIGEKLFYKVRNYADENMNFNDARLCEFYTEEELENRIR